MFADDIIVFGLVSGCGGSNGVGGMIGGGSGEWVQ